ncbi:unnamed protein product [Rotaria sp. Silwood1]|nr:unnamed protein product [Rotaria sp. Silwood1]
MIFFYLLEFYIIFKVFSVLGTITAISGTAVPDRTQEAQRGAQIGQSITSVLLYGLGLWVAYRYNETGLRIFAWIGIIAMVVFSIVIIIVIALIIRILVSSQPDHKNLKVALSISIVVVVIVCIAAYILTIIIIKLSFKLAKQIESKKSLATPQI